MSLKGEISALANARNNLQMALQAFTSLLADYPTEKQSQSGACGAWSPREVVAHLIGWLKEASYHYYCIADGDKSDMLYKDHDADENFFVHSRADLSWEMMMAELEGASYIFLYQTEQIRSDSDKHYIDWLIALTREFRHHAEDLQSFSGVHL